MGVNPVPALGLCHNFYLVRCERALALRMRVSFSDGMALLLAGVASQDSDRRGGSHSGLFSRCLTGGRAFLVQPQNV